MGWTVLLRSDNFKVGYVGDEIWDAAGDMVEKLLKIDVNLSEKAITELVLGCMSKVDFVPSKLRRVVCGFLLKASGIYTRGLGRAPNEDEIESSIQFVYETELEKVKEEQNG
jgi:hypothetical protein